MHDSLADAGDDRANVKVDKTWAAAIALRLKKFRRPQRLRDNFSQTAADIQFGKYFD